MTGPNPTDRGKLGTKRHVLTDKKGIPLSIVITAGNTHDMKAAIKTIDGILVKRRRRRSWLWMTNLIMLLFSPWA